MAKSKYSDLSKTGENLTNLNSVVDSVLNIINTRIGTIPFKRDFGSRIEDYLFYPYLESTTKLILSEMISSITKWEKRVTINPDSTVELSRDPDTRVYEVYLYVEIEGFPDPVLVRETLEPK